MLVDIEINVNVKFNVFVKASNDWKCMYKMKFSDFEYSWKLLTVISIYELKL